MTMIVIDPLTRVEGHSRVTIYVQEGRVIDVKFNAIELRGFETFVRGADANTMPHVVSRICGVCSTAHHLASVKALENAYDVNPPKRAMRVRELMMLGQTIESHAMSLFFLALPDFYYKKASIFELMDVDPALTREAVLVRKAGSEIIARAGRRGIHPTNATAGGVYQVIDRATADYLKELTAKAVRAAGNLLDRTWDIFLERRDEILSTAAEPTYYITALDPVRSFYGDHVLVIRPDGEVELRSAPWEIPTYLTVDPREESFAPIIHYGGQPIRTNSLARINAFSGFGTPIADSYVERLKKDWGLPVHATLLFDICRGVEIIFSLERARELAERCLEPGPLIVKFKKPKEGTGIGLVEAPRGVLYHEYHIEKGVIENARFFIPTQHNLFALERAIAQEAQAHVSPDRMDMKLEAEVERVIRAFDICVSCATHEIKVVGA
ncbi:MAG: Ni/Fe hydrogenase subunit alpha [Actinobacteria bacterium]|nr:Ni/Fe hydrogenase subunit alpha [Actinomycetota bacterium]